MKKTIRITLFLFIIIICLIFTGCFQKPIKEINKKTIIKKNQTQPNIGDIEEIINVISNKTYKMDDPPEIYKCLAKVKRNISLCDSAEIQHLKEYMSGCEQDYYFFISIIDKDIGMCNFISDESIKSSCIDIVSKNSNMISQNLCTTKPAACEYLINNNFKIDDGFCDISMNTALGRQRCKAAINKDEKLCYESTT